MIDSGVDLDASGHRPESGPRGVVLVHLLGHADLADPSEVANGDCSNKAAVQDRNGHGTHVASTIAARRERDRDRGRRAAGDDRRAQGMLRSTGFCFAKPVAAALRKAGDLRLDVVNLSLFADPYPLLLQVTRRSSGLSTVDMFDAAKYAQQRGVVIVAAAGNEATDLRHVSVDTISPDWPPDSAVERVVRNNCRQSPAEIPASSPSRRPDRSRSPRTRTSA